MIGQKRLLSNIDNLTLDELPRTILLVGDKGCGKHFLCQYICDKFEIQKSDFSHFRDIEKETKTDLGEILADYYRHTYNSLLIFDAEFLYERDECTLLKFLEEPPSHSHIVIVAQNKNQLLETIRNRCTIMQFENYTKDELSQFISSDNADRDILLQVCTTPGQILQFQGFDFHTMHEYINTVIDKLEYATDSNILNISNKIAYKNEKDKFDFFAFINTLLVCARNKCIETKRKRNEIIYQQTCEMMTKLNIIGIDKKNVFENYLITLKLQLEGIRQ